VPVPPGAVLVNSPNGSVIVNWRSTVPSMPVSAATLPNGSGWYSSSEPLTRNDNGFPSGWWK
jgi:hypothetical protein